MPVPLTPVALIPLAHRAALGIARFWDDVRELEARRAILQRPWDHQALHWSGPGPAALLHGRTLPRPGAVLPPSTVGVPVLPIHRRGSHPTAATDDARWTALAPAAAVHPECDTAGARPLRVSGRGLRPHRGSPRAPVVGRHSQSRLVTTARLSG
jgi:hypothetical protein